MKKNIQHKIDSLRSKASKTSPEKERAVLSERKNSLSESIRNKKEAEDFRISYEVARDLAKKN
ncbi:hypothetical protein ACKW6Q_10410 [Chryseobacterium kwangjuense]|uniref:Prevent-host-death protein n=1 Tax=Chryseobacterium kwangjuense TaxID=267125 RepID=A0ABW9K3X9_9FLAO